MIAAMLLPIILSPTPIQRVLLLDQAEDQRPLLIFAPTADDPRVQRQCSILNILPLLERDVVVALAPLGGGSPLCPNLTARVAAHLMNTASARRRFHISPGSFTVLLLGKDGGEKLRSHSPIAPETLIQTIDSMPMRRQEMQKRSTEPKSP